MMKVTFDFEKDTKNTVRFKETNVGPLDVAKLGTLYVPKTSLKEIDYVEGAQLEVTITTIK